MVRPLRTPGHIQAGRDSHRVWAFVMFAMIDTGNWYLITAGLSISHIFISMMYGPQAALLANYLAPRFAIPGFTGLSVGRDLRWWFAPIIATTLLLIFGSLCGLLPTLLLRMC